MSGVKGQGLVATAGGEHREAFLLQVEPDEVHDVALVVDDEDGLHRPTIALGVGPDGHRRKLDVSRASGAARRERRLLRIDPRRAPDESTRPMFATLLGPLPRPPLGDGAGERDLVEAAVRAQEAAGIEPITDGGFGVAGSPVERWGVTAALTSRAVKQALVGPYSAGRSAGRRPAGRAGLRRSPPGRPPQAVTLPPRRA